jgi:hypothetical protein
VLVSAVKTKKFNSGVVVRIFLRLLLTFGLTALIVACGGGGGGGSGGGGNNVPIEPTPPNEDNVQAITVNGGPRHTVNLAYTSVTVCVPSTSQCQTINNMAVDTGSSGLRVLASALNGLLLPQQTTLLNHALVECVQFVDLSHVWGPVKLADVKIAGKTANTLPIQVIGGSAFSNEPITCANGDSSANMDTVAKLGANGILGVGNFQQDCGDDCSLHIANNVYYDCSNSTCTQTTATLASQVQNPIALFADDNNGVIIDLPATSASIRVDGRMIFGIGTRANNALGNATIYTTSSSGHIETEYKGFTYSRSFVDSGSNGLFFPDSSIPECTLAIGFYCPSNPLHLNATIIGLNGKSSNIPFSVVNIELQSSSFSAFSTLAGSYNSGFDWGLPFFFGRKVYTALESNPEGPYIAF